MRMEGLHLYAHGVMQEEKGTSVKVAIYLYDRQ